MSPARKVSSLDAEIIERQVRICKAFAHPTRLLMLDLLGRREWAASALQKELGVSNANLSQHVAVMRAAGIVSARRQGKLVYFSLAMPEVKSACRMLRDVLRAQVRAGQRLGL